MSKRTDDESCAFALLRSANPVRLEDIQRELDEERIGAALAHAYATLRGRPQPIARRRTERAGGGSPRHARRLRLVGAAAAVAAAVGVALTALPAMLPGGAEPARAMRVLTAAATVARAQPAPAPGPGEYTYVKQRFGIIGGPSGTVEWWIASDGSGRMHLSGPSTTGVITYEDGRGVERRVILEGHDRTPRDATFGPGRFAEFYEQVNPGVLDGRIDGLPTDPKALEVMLRRELREERDFNPDPATQSLQMLQLIEEILANPLASPDLRSAAYETAAGLEGVEIREQATDPVGRPATAIALCSAAIPARYEVFFDPATSDTLGTREVHSSCDGANSQRSGLTSYGVYLEQGTVDSIHHRP
jgi:hypothetical protein